MCLEELSKDRIIDTNEEGDCDKRVKMSQKKVTQAKSLHESNSWTFFTT